MGKKNGEMSNYITDFAANLRWRQQKLKNMDVKFDIVIECKLVAFNC